MAAPPQVFVDGLGARQVVRDEGSGALHEHLILDRELVETPGFLVALGERVARLGAFRNACYARVGHVEALPDGGAALVSEFTHGWRLSQILSHADAAGVAIAPPAVFGLVRQLLPAVALLSQHAREVAHGALAPERLIVTPQGRLVVTEHVLASAIEALQYGRERLWREFRVATPPAAGLPRMGPRTDVMQAGLVTIALVLGRPLGDADLPDGLPALVEEARACLERHGSGVVAGPVCEWLSRALQLDARASFQSLFDAQASLERVLAGDRGALTAPASIESLLARLALPPVVPPEAAPPIPHEGIEPESALMAVMVDEAGGAAAAAFATREGREAGEAAEAVASVSQPAIDVAATTVIDVAEAAVPDAVAAVVPPAPASPDLRAPSSRRLVQALAAVAIIALVEAALIVGLWNRAPAPSQATEGELVVQSRPIAARVIVDGEDRGATPLTMTLPAGSHVLQVAVSGSEPRVIPLMIQPGVQTAQYVELLNVPTTGVLEIRSDPARARVFVDGRDHGLTPLTIRDLPPGEREVILEHGSRRVTQRVRVEPGTTAQLVVPLP
ncbi:MAG: PEGA domain-containing protein [Vicinamibacterales bacterium]|nr:PEGA domain-containing protein [Vicinamibacterales bacterium]